MAKKHTTAGHDVGSVGDAANTVVVAIPANLILKYGDWEIDATSASAATLAYCLQNGFHQSMVDAAAFSKADKEGKTEEEVEDMAATKRQARFEAIRDGKVGSRAGGPRAKGIDKYIIDAANKAIAAFAAKKGVKLPDGKGAADKLKVLRDNWLANPDRAMAVRVAAETAMAADEELVAGTADFDFDAAS